MSKGRVVAVIAVGAAAFAAVALVAWLVAPTGPSRADAVAAVVGEVIVPDYAAFATAAAVLSARAAQGCDDLDGLRADWRQARTAWKRSEAHAFGPVQEERLTSVVDFWPGRPWVVAEVLAGSAPLDAAGVAALSAPARGLPALDLLLFGPPSAALAGRPCTYVQGLTADLARVGARLSERWAPAGGYLQRLQAMQGQGLDDVVNQLVSLAYSIEDMKLARPLGKRHGNVPQPDALESPHSKHGAADLLANVDGMKAVYARLAPLVAKSNPDADDRVRAALDELEARVRALGPDLAAVATAGAPAGNEVFEAAKRTTRLMSTELVTALGVTLRFSDNDGD